MISLAYHSVVHEYRKGCGRARSNIRSRAIDGDNDFGDLGLIVKEAQCHRGWRSYIA
ncbi:MAG: hypothetical protein P4L51_00985 [Puia sp.]|nr:hypothetical protein [Puia sp.]